jgi:hypothetical protein
MQNAEYDLVTTTEERVIAKRLAFQLARDLHPCGGIGRQ